MDFKEKKVPKIHTSYFLIGKSMYQLRLKMQEEKACPHKFYQSYRQKVQLHVFFQRNIKVTGLISTPLNIWVKPSLDLNNH